MLALLLLLGSVATMARAAAPLSGFVQAGPDGFTLNGQRFFISGANQARRAGPRGRRICGRAAARVGDRTTRVASLAARRARAPPDEAGAARSIKQRRTGLRSVYCAAI